MNSPALALQAAIRARLIASPDVTALVPITSIFDRHARPETFPCIVLGEDQEIDDTAPLARDRVSVFATLHIWHREPGLVGVKQIAGAVRAALKAGAWDLDGYRTVDAMTTGARFLRDPDGMTSHGVVTVEVLLSEVA